MFLSNDPGGGRGRGQRPRARTGGSGTVGEGSTRFPGRNHGSQWPRGRSGSTWARNGKGRGGPRGMPGTDGCPPGGSAGSRSETGPARGGHARGNSRACHLGQDSVKITAEYLDGGPGGSGARPEHENPCREKGFAHFHKFTKLPTDAVAAHGRPVLAGEHIPHVGPGKCGIENHGAGQHSRAQVHAFGADAGEGGAALDAVDQALSL